MYFGTWGKLRRAQTAASKSWS